MMICQAIISTNAEYEVSGEIKYVLDVNLNEKYQWK